MIKKIVFLWLCILSSTFAAEEFVAGTDYQVIASSEKPKSNQAVPVTEFFSYGCPWCFRLEASLDKWVSQQGSNIDYQKVPVVFKPDWEFYAKAYYTVSALSLDKKLNPELFKAIQTDKQLLNSNQAMVDFLSQHGVDKAVSESAFYHSPNIDLKIAESKQAMGRYQITGVPALLVNNQYKTDLQMAKSETRLFAILDYLVAKSKKGS